MTPIWNRFAESSTGTALLSLDRWLKPMTRVELLLLVGGLQLIWACMIVGLFAETPVGLKTIGMVISLAGVLL